MKVDVPESAVRGEICIDAAKTALVVIDMQNDFVKDGGGLLVPDAEPTLPAIKRLLELARASRIRVVYSQDTTIRATLNGTHGRSTAGRAVGGGRLSPNSRPMPRTRSFAKFAMTRSTAPRSIICSGCGHRHARYLRHRREHRRVLHSVQRSAPSV
jgi:Isochorismatase family